MAKTNLQTTFKDLSITIPNSYKEKMETLINDCFVTWNFIIIPKKKIFKINEETNKTISWKGYIINKDGKFDEIEIESSNLSNWWSFEKLLANTEWYYIEGKNGFSYHLVKKNTLAQKKLIDFFCSIDGLVKNVEDYEKIGYFDSNTIIYSNGILDLNKREFLEKEILTCISDQLLFTNFPKKYDIVESHIGLSSIFDELIQNKVFKFILKGFFVSSIFREEMFEYFESFPLFYISGLRWKGKTFLLKLLSSIIGFEKWYVTSVSSTTPHIFKRNLDEVNFYNFMDESHKMDDKRIEILKGNYDWYKIERWNIGKNWLERLKSNNKSVLFISWESIIGEEALQTRCIIHNFGENDVKQLNENDKRRIIKDWNNYFQNILLHKKDVDIKNIIKRGKGIIEDLNIDVEKRVKNNLLVVVCGNLLLDDSLDYEEVGELIKEYLKMNCDNIEETISYNIVEDVINDFAQYSSLLEYQKKSKIPQIYVSNEKIYLNFREIVKTYIKKHNLKVGVLFVQNQLLNYIWISNTNLKDRYSKFRLYDWFTKELFSLSKEEVMENEILKNIWNRCLLQIKKDVSIIEDTIIKLDNKREQTKEDLNIIENYQKLTKYWEKLIEINGLVDFEVKIEDEVQNKFETKMSEMTSIYHNYTKWKFPILTLDKEDMGIYFNIKGFINYFEDQKNFLKDGEISDKIKEIFGISTISLNLFDIDWIESKSEKEYIKIPKEIIESKDIWGVIYDNLLVEYYNDKKLIKEGYTMVYDVVLKKDETKKLIEYIDGRVRVIFDI